MSQIPFTPAADILGRTAPLDYRASFPFQGIPLEVQSNSPLVLELAERSFGVWRKLAKELIASVPKLTMNIIVHSANEPEELPGRIVYRMFSDCLLAASGSNIFITQTNSGTGLVFVTPETVAENGYFQSYFLESPVLSLVTKLDRNPIHAGVVVRKGRPIMLIAKSGIGKSTLCYACVRDGLQFLAEDAVFISTQNGLILWYGSRTIGLNPDVVHHFPELADAKPQVTSNGDLKVVIDTTELAEDRMCLHAEDPIVCILQRHDLEASDLKPASSQVVMDALCNDIESGFDRNRNRHKIAQALAEKEKYILTIGNDLHDAISLLRSITD